MESTTERMVLVENITQTNNSDQSNQTITTELDSPNPFQEIVNQFESCCSTAETDTKIAELRASTLLEEFTPDSIGETELVNLIKTGIPVTEMYRDRTIELYTLTIICIGVIAFNLKEIVLRVPGARWGEYVATTFKGVVKKRALQIYIRISKFNDCKTFAFLGVKTLDKLISKIKDSNTNAEEILPYLEDKMSYRGLDFTSDTNREIVKKELKDFLKKAPHQNISPEEQENKRYETLKKELTALTDIHVPFLSSLSQDKRRELLVIMEDGVQKINDSLQTEEGSLPVEVQLELPIASDA